MGELLAHFAYNPITAHSRMVVKESGYKSHQLKVNGHESLSHSTTSGGPVLLNVPDGMQVVPNSDFVVSRDRASHPENIPLSPGQQVTLKHLGPNRVLHTVSCLPRVDVDGSVVKALARAKVARAA